MNEPLTGMQRAIDCLSAVRPALLEIRECLYLDNGTETEKGVYHSTHDTLHQLAKALETLIDQHKAIDKLSEAYGNAITAVAAHKKGVN